jgi:CRISPR-associated protein Cmr4
MTQKTTIIGLHSQTSIHAGTGSSIGVIDLPIQREGHNGWPCIFGSAVKGALRARAEEEYGKRNDSVIYVFGEETDKGHELAGAIAISDARLLLLPVRSLTSQFKWVTCPAAIKRFELDAARFGTTLSIADDLDVDEDKALVAGEHNQNRLFLEEYRFDTKVVKLDSVIDAILPLMANASKRDLEKQLVIISDDNFSHLTQHVTPVNAHIAIDSETKLVKPGALWYEETLPPETLLYFGISAVASRTKKVFKIIDTPPDDIKLDASQVMGAVTNLFANGWLQLGGNETVGMGWCAVSNYSANKQEDKGGESCN